MFALSAIFVFALWQSANVAEGAGFSVSGTKILDSNGEEFIMRGINHGHIWFLQDLEVAVPSMAATGANILRIILSDGDVWTRTPKENVSLIIDLCEANKVICMLDVHDTLGQNDQSYLNNAIQYWKDVKDALIGKEDKVIINIANEYLTSYDGYTWATQYKEAIQTLRNEGFTHLFVIDCPGWGQDAGSCASYGSEVFAADTLSNTAFSIHMYEVAGNGASTVKSNIDNSLAINHPVLVGEFGFEAQGVDVSTILSYSEEKSVGWIAWSWYGNTDPSFDMATDATGNTLTSRGEEIINGANGIKATAKPASIYQ